MVLGAGVERADLSDCVQSGLARVVFCLFINAGERYFILVPLQRDFEPVLR